MQDIGQEFIPYKVFTGIFIPTGLMQYQGVSAGSKLVWGVLARFSGQRGFCWPSNATIAYECGMSERGVRKCLSELESKGFLVRKGMHKQCVVWAFLMHESLLEDRNKVPGLDAESSTQPRNKVRLPRNKVPGSGKNSDDSEQSAEEPRNKVPRFAEQSADDMNNMSQLHESLSTNDSDTLVESMPPEPPANPLLKEIMELYIALVFPGKPLVGDYEELQELISEFTAEDVMKALNEAHKRHIRRRSTLPYIKPILKRWNAKRQEGEGLGAVDEYGGNWS